MADAGLIEEWYRAARPLLLVDEIRHPGARSGEQLVSTVLLETDTRCAVAWAQAADTIRAGLASPAQDVAFKGSTLYGSRWRPSHQPMRDYVRHSLGACLSGFVVTTSNQVLRDHPSRRGGIRPVPATEADRLRVKAVRGPELVPLLNSVKVIAVEQGFGSIQVDVLVDRSRQLGFDPKSLGTEADTVSVFGPNTLNETSDGSQSQLICPTQFRIISASETSPLRDLLLLPDAAAYKLHRHQALRNAQAALASGKEFWIEHINLSSLLPDESTATQK